jgi:1-acyl-sn-glycerol-3-phosphate acyltransferase
MAPGRKDLLGFPVVAETTLHTSTELPSFARYLLRQRLLGWIAFPVLGPALALAMRIAGRYTVRNRKQIRLQFRQIVRDNPHLLICPNHLTMIDSAIIQWALASNLYYFFHYRKLPWNIPAIENFGHSFFLRLITYLTKCIPIDRRGPVEHREDVLNRMTWLLQDGDPILLFPEGRRSRTGRLDLEGAAYGPGLLLQRVPDTAVLCIYLRGDHQTARSTLPVKGEQFTLTMRLIRPKTDMHGLRGQRDLAQRILAELQSMEEDYFRSKT